MIFVNILRATLSINQWSDQNLAGSANTVTLIRIFIKNTKLNIYTVIRCQNMRLLEIYYVNISSRTEYKDLFGRAPTNHKIVWKTFNSFFVKDNDANIDTIPHLFCRHDGVDLVVALHLHPVGRLGIRVDQDLDAGAVLFEYM